MNKHPAIRLADALEGERHTQPYVVTFFREAADYIRTLHGELQQYRNMVVRLLHDTEQSERKAIYLEACNEVLVEAVWRLLRAESSEDLVDARARALRSVQLARKPAQGTLQ